MHIRWDRGTNIALKELLAIVLAAAIWSNMMVLFKCENLAAVSDVNSGSSHNDHMICTLQFVVAHFRFTFKAKHIPGAKNNVVKSNSD